MAAGLPPVLVLAWRRPELTDGLMRILRASGCEIYAAVDGPRPGRGDEPAVARTREVVRDSGVPAANLLLRDTNLGGPRGTPQAIDWFFGRTDRGIILEDDLAPHPSFFRFAAELLEKYEQEPRVAAIHGWTCRLEPPANSYYFSRYAPGWGWATWASRWKDFDRAGRLAKDVDLAEVLRGLSHGDRSFVRHWLRVLDWVYVKGRMNWDFRWVFTNFVLGRVTATAGTNLIDNLGWGGAAANYAKKPFCHLPVQQMRFPLTHPAQIAVDFAADRDEHDASFLARPSMRVRYGYAALKRAARSFLR